MLLWFSYSVIVSKRSYEGGASPVSLTKPDINCSCKWVQLAGESHGNVSDAPGGGDVMRSVGSRSVSEAWERPLAFPLRRLRHGHVDESSGEGLSDCSASS